MASFNRVLLLGNLTRDPQLKYLPSQMAVVEFGLACNRKFRTAAGEDREEVVARRLRDAAEEIRNYNSYDYVLINRELAEAEATLSAIVRAERARLIKIEDQIRPILDTFQV